MRNERFNCKFMTKQRNLKKITFQNFSIVLMAKPSNDQLLWKITNNFQKNWAKFIFYIFLVEAITKLLFKIFSRLSMNVITACVVACVVMEQFIKRVDDKKSSNRSFDLMCNLEFINSYEYISLHVWSNWTFYYFGNYIFTEIWTTENFNIGLGKWNKVHSDENFHSIVEIEISCFM